MILHCYSCFKRLSESSILRCSRCKLVIYCNKICQRSHWKLHKADCLPYHQFKQWEQFISTRTVKQTLDTLLFVEDPNKIKTTLVSMKVKKIFNALKTEHGDSADTWLHGCLRTVSNVNSDRKFESHYLLFRKLWSSPGMIELIMNKSLISEHITKIRQKEMNKLSFKRYLKRRKYLLTEQFYDCDDEDFIDDGRTYPIKKTHGAVFEYSFFIINLLVKTISMDHCYGLSHSSDKDGESPLINSFNYALKDKWPKYLLDNIINKLLEIYRNIDILTSCGMAVAPIANVIYQYFVSGHRKRVVIDSQFIHSCLFLIKYDMNKHGPFNILSSIQKHELQQMDVEERRKAFVFLHQFIIQYDEKKIQQELEQEMFTSPGIDDKLTDFIDQIKSFFLRFFSNFMDFFRILASINDLKCNEENIICLSPFECFTWFEKRYYHNLVLRFQQKILNNERYVKVLYNENEWKRYIMVKGFKNMRKWRKIYSVHQTNWKNKRCDYTKCKLNKWKCKGVFWKCKKCKNAFYCSKKCQKYDWNGRHRSSCC
eukprot:348143_1